MLTYLSCSRELRADPDAFNSSSEKVDRFLTPKFQILNLVPDSPKVFQDEAETRKFIEDIRILIIQSVKQGWVG